MQDSLVNAIKEDLRKFKLQGKPELSIYCRYLVGEAYMKKEGETNTHKYMVNKDLQSIRNEIKNSVYRGNNILDVNNLLDKAGQSIANEYLNNLSMDNKINDTGLKSKTSDITVVTSLKEALEKMIEYYVQKNNAMELVSITDLSKKILLNYFEKDNARVFSAKNGTRQYVTSKTKEELIDEMQRTLMFYSDSKIVIDTYATAVANSYIKSKNMRYEANGINSLGQMIEQEINNANLNNAQKEWLNQELLNGNINSLQGFVSQQLHDEYKKISEKTNTGSYGSI